MRFWDSSAVVPLVLEEPTSTPLKRHFGDDPEQIVWWATEVEVTSAIARRERTGALIADDVATALSRLDTLARAWQEIAPRESVRRAARRLLRVHDLRAADALQLAAALVASENRPDTLELVTLDERLAPAASREGFSVLPA